MVLARSEERDVSAGFGLLLRRHRTAAGMTQVRLAERSGYYVNYLRKIERGERRPSGHVMRALADALQLSPTDRALFERVARDGAPSHGTAGRQIELSALEASLARSGRGMLVLTGPPGIGKTHLLRGAQWMAEERGMLTLRATCRPTDTAPLAPIQEALERPLWDLRPEERIQTLSGCERLSRLIAESIGVTFHLRPVLTPEQELELIFEAIVRFLGRLAAGRDIVLLLDDLHLADGTTLDLVGRLLWLSELPLRVVGTCRDTYPDLSEPLSATLDEMVRAGMLARLPLGPLDDTESDALLDDLLADAAGSEHRKRLIRRAGGIPGYLVSLASGPLDGPVPEDLAGDIRSRLAWLPQGGQEALAAVAIAGGSAPIWLIGDACGTTASASELALDSPCAAGLLRREEDVYTCHCGIIAEIVAASLPPARRVALRDRIAEARAAEEVMAQAGLRAVPTARAAITPAGWCAGS